MFAFNSGPDGSAPHRLRLDDSPEQTPLLEQLLNAAAETEMLGVARAQTVGSQNEEAALIVYRLHSSRCVRPTSTT